MAEAKVVNLDGTPITEAIPKECPLSVLRDLVSRLECGELNLESVLVIGTKPNPDDPSLVSHPTWDSGIRSADALFMMEVAKFNLLEMMKVGA